MNKIPLILDCDPGVDDSFALALLAASPQIELLAVTPVEGNVPASRTRRNALGLCQMLGLDCRVAFGAERPLRKAYTRDASAVHGASGVGSLVFPEITRTPDPLPAWEVIYREAVRCGGQLVLLAVGPLTNIATALRLHPDLPRYLKKLCIMGGGTFGNVAASGGRAEFNTWVDPTAAKEVFAQVEVWMVGLDATHASAVTAADFDEMIALCGSGDGALVPRELARFSKQNSLENGCDNHIIHDALAAASLDRLGCSFQISTCGIIPGEGARSRRLALDQKTLGVPVLAIGVPTVTDAATLACDLLGLEAPPEKIREGFLVTPGDIDLLAAKSAKAVGYGVNLALHGNMPVSDMEQLLA